MVKPWKPHRRGKDSLFASVSFSQGAGRLLGSNTPRGAVHFLVPRENTTESCRIRPVWLYLAALRAVLPLNWYPCLCPKEAVRLGAQTRSFSWASCCLFLIVRSSFWLPARGACGLG